MAGGGYGRPTPNLRRALAPVLAARLLLGQTTPSSLATACVRVRACQLVGTHRVSRTRPSALAPVACVPRRAHRLPHARPASVLTSISGLAPTAHRHDGNAQTYLRRQAAQQPRHLRCICLCDGTSDIDRDLCRQGSILLPSLPQRVDQVSHRHDGQGFRGSACFAEKRGSPLTIKPPRTKTPASRPGLLAGSYFQFTPHSFRRGGVGFGA